MGGFDLHLQIKQIGLDQANKVAGERGRRIELLALAWKAKVLPLYEPRLSAFAVAAAFAHAQGLKNLLVERAGFEPAYS